MAAIDISGAVDGGVERFQPVVALSSLVMASALTPYLVRSGLGGGVFDGNPVALGAPLEVAATAAAVALQVANTLGLLPGPPEA